VLAALAGGVTRYDRYWEPLLVLVLGIVLLIASMR